MTKQQFMTHMQNLLKVFGRTEYENRMEVIYELVADLPEANFAWIVKHFTLTKSVKYPPLPEEFREAAQLQRKHIRENVFQKEIRQNDEPESGGVVLKQFLEKLGAKSPTEALEKIKQR